MTLATHEIFGTQMPRFVFVTTEVTYKQVSDLAIKEGMTVPEYVSRAIEHYADRNEGQNNTEE
jgi:hypothetical protein